MRIMIILLFSLLLGCAAPVLYAYKYEDIDNDRADISFRICWDNTFSLKLKSESDTGLLLLKAAGIWIMSTQSDTVQISVYESNFKNISYESVFCFPYFKKVSPNTFRFCIHEIVNIWGVVCELKGP